jgi:hypothetical protein
MSVYKVGDEEVWLVTELERLARVLPLRGALREVVHNECTTPLRDPIAREGTTQ